MAIILLFKEKFFSDIHGDDENFKQKKERK